MRIRRLIASMAAMRPSTRAVHLPVRTRRRRGGWRIRPRKAHLYSSMGLGWAGIVKRDPCSFCGVLPPHNGQTVEHVEPLARGGTGSWDNLAGACLRCNQAKGDQPLLLFLVERARDLVGRPRAEALHARPESSAARRACGPEFIPAKGGGFKLADVVRVREV